MDAPQMIVADGESGKGGKPDVFVRLNAGICIIDESNKRSIKKSNLFFNCMWTLAGISRSPHE
jgi:hypothetical protein